MSALVRKADVRAATTVKGHKRTLALQMAMSALPPKADMCSATRNVR